MEINFLHSFIGSDYAKYLEIINKISNDPKYISYIMKIIDHILSAHVKCPHEDIDAIALDRSAIIKLNYGIIIELFAIINKFYNKKLIEIISFEEAFNRYKPEMQHLIDISCNEHEIYIAYIESGDNLRDIMYILIGIVGDYLYNIINIIDKTEIDHRDHQIVKESMEVLKFTKLCLFPYLYFIQEMVNCKEKFISQYDAVEEFIKCIMKNQVFLSPDKSK